MININKLSFDYADGRTGLAEVDLTIPDGQLMVVAGANGSGKTTLLRHLNGLLIPRRGNVIIDGMAVVKNIRHIRQMVGMVFQESDSQIIGETVFSDVAFGPENLSWPRDVMEAAVNAVLAQVGLAHLADKSPHLLSGGERKRLAIAGIMVMRPRVYLFDEPFANLDYPGIRSILRQIVYLHREGCTIIIAAHDIEKIAYHAQRLVILNRGRIVADGSLEMVLPLLETYDVRQPCLSRAGHPVDSWLN